MGSIRIVAEIQVKSEFISGLMPVFDTLVKGSRSEAGNKSYEFTEEIDQPGHFFVIEEWLSEKAIEEHGATTHFRAFVAAIDGKTEKLVINKLKKVF